MCISTENFDAFFSSPELQEQVSFSDQNLSVVRHCCYRKLFTFSSFSQEPLANFNQIWHKALLIDNMYTNITDIWFWFSVPLPNHHLCLALPSIMSSIVKQCWRVVCVSLLTLSFVLELMKALKLNFPAVLVGWRSEGGKQFLLVQPGRGRIGREVHPGGTEWAGCCLWWHRNHHSLQKTGRTADIYL